jgi:polyvinyl alcohol dehydrogenase (cytochrome)
VRGRSWPIAVALTLLLAACADDGGGSEPASSAPHATASADAEADGGATIIDRGAQDLGNSRLYPDETAVTAETVAHLTEAWTLNDVIGVTGTPTIVDGVAYFGDWAGNARAVDPATGDEVWTTELGGAVIGTTPVDGDAVFASAGTTLYRLDRQTGEVQWEASTHDHPFAMISASPVVAGGVVLQGVASGEITVAQPDYGFLGAIGAYDIDTGEEVWRFVTTPGDDTSGAGVGIWSTPAVNVERGVLYFGTGNTYEEPSSPRADAIVALDLETGEEVWTTQFTRTDVFSAGNPFGSDADVGTAPNLWTADGRDLVGAADKAGTYHALDRETGEVVWETELSSGSYLGGAIGTAAFADGRLIVTSNVGNPEDNSPGTTVAVFALDPATGDVLWDIELEDTIYAPVSAVPGVAFVGTLSGAMIALDTATGDELWRTEAPNSVGAGPAVQDGAVLWGYGFALFDGPGDGGVLAFTLPDRG